MAKRGRPKKPSTKNRKRRTIRFSDEEWDMIKRKAGKTNSSLSRYIRSTALGYELSSKVDNDTLVQMGKIGNNLNQLTRHVNTTHRFGPKQTDEIRKIREAMEKIAMKILDIEPRD